jgi:hypothetical protein
VTTPFILKKNASIAKALQRPASFDRSQPPPRNVRSVPSLMRNDLTHPGQLPRIKSPGRVPEQMQLEDVDVHTDSSDEEENKKELEEGEEVPSFFPLETFDDGTFETKTPDEWLQVIICCVLFTSF